MKVSIKTLKGEQFQVEASPTDSISVVKEAIFAAKPEFQTDRQKLIHSGKVLKDNVTLSESGITESDFVVCMITKETAKAKTSVAAPAPVPAAAPAPSIATAPQAIPSIPPAALAPAPIPAPLPVVINEEAVTQILDMGFPETEVRAALQAANGNADLAVEFLMNGIPEHALNAMASQRTAAGGAPSGGAVAQTGSIEQLRQHPQFDQLRLVVQQNPNQLPRVLEMIGQQDPGLLGLIHANQEQFLAMMNEPITSNPSVNPAAHSPVIPPGFGAGAGAGGDPTQALQLLMALPPAQRNQAAQAMGISPDQLNSLTQLLNTMPADQLQRLMGAMGGPGGAMGGPGGPGGVPPGGNIVRLTEEEMTSVTRLTELGFDQQDALAAYLACDKNEALAANLLLEGWSSGDMGGGGDDGMYEGGPDDMYS